MDIYQAVAYLGSQHAVVRFYRDDEDGQEMVRVVIEDEIEEYRTVVKKQVFEFPTEAFVAATEQAKAEFEATARRAAFRAV